MWIVMDKKFQLERKRFHLKSSCEDCTHYCHKRDACAMQYPVQQHKQKSFDQANDQDRIYFCKLFEVK